MHDVPRTSGDAQQLAGLWCAPHFCCPHRTCHPHPGCPCIPTAVQHQVQLLCSHQQLETITYCPNDCSFQREMTGPGTWSVAPVAHAVWVSCVLSRLLGAWSCCSLTGRAKGCVGAGLWGHGLSVIPEPNEIECSIEAMPEPVCFSSTDSGLSGSHIFWLPMCVQWLFILALHSVYSEAAGFGCWKEALSCSVELRKFLSFLDF